MIKRATLVLGLACAIGFSGEPDLPVLVKDADKLRAFWGVKDAGTQVQKALSEVKVVLITHGLSGGEKELKRWVPAGAELVGDASPSPASERSFGFRIAHLLWATSGYLTEGPLLRVVDGSTPSGFEKGMETAREWGADLVVCTENLEGYGDFNGKGFVNAEIEALVKNQETIWLQNAGKYRGWVTNAPVKLPGRGKNEWVSFGKEAKDHRKLWIRSEKTLGRLSLSWNANRRTVSGKGKDLNLVIFASEAKGAAVVASSELKQVVTPSDKADETVFPFEQVLLDKLPASDVPYVVRVLDKSGNFSADVDELRLTLTSPKPSYPLEDGTLFRPIELEGTDPWNQIMVPADSPYVVTVGDLSSQSALGEPVEGQSEVKKPDLILDWLRPAFTDGEALPEGPHTAVAQLGGIVARLKAELPDFSAPAMTKWVLKMREKRSAGNFPVTQATLEKEGWKFGASDLQQGATRANGLATLYRGLGDSVMAVSWTSAAGANHRVGLRKPIPDIAWLKNVTAEAAYAPHRYYTFLCSKSDDTILILSVLKDSQKRPWDNGKTTAYDCLEIVPLPLGLSASDFTKAKSVRWLTPTAEELKALVN